MPCLNCVRLFLHTLKIHQVNFISKISKLVDRQVKVYVPMMDVYKCQLPVRDTLAKSKFSHCFENGIQ